jgi:hypothetical protein
MRTRRVSDKKQELRTHRITLDKSPVMSLSVNSYERRNAEMIWLRQNENLRGHLLIQTFWNAYLSHDGDRKSFDVNILTLPLETIDTVAFFIAETLLGIILCLCQYDHISFGNCPLLVSSNISYTDKY